MTQRKSTQKGITGLGYLYKRDRNGRKIPATSKADGTFWLRARGADGKTTDRRLLDEDGRSVSDLALAKALQRRQRAPFLTGSRIAELEAQTAEAERLRKKQENEREIAEPPLSINAAWAEYLRAPNRRQCGEGTLGNYHRHWGQFLRWLGKAHNGARFLRDVTAEIAEDYAAHLTASGESANTYNKHTTFLRSFFALLTKPARLDGNPFAEIQRRRQKPESRRALTLDELRRVIQSADGELRTLLEIGIYTGLRLGDCCTLEWREIDLVAGALRREPRKTAHTSEVVVEIGMPYALRARLAGLPREGRYVLPGIAERYLKYPQGVSKSVMRHLRDCGLAVHEKAGRGRIQPIVRVSFHSLRHTWVSLQMERGTPAALVQKAAGHSSPAMTEHYTHIGAEGLRQMARAVDMDFSGNGNAGTDMAADKIKALLERFRRAKGEKGETELEELAIKILLERLDKDGE